MKKIFFLAPVVCLLFLVFCTNQNTTENTSDENLVENNITTSTDASATTLEIFDKGNLVCKLSVGNQISFNYKNKDCISEMSGDKRKYMIVNGSMFAEIKFKGNDFKLRDKSGSLLWKVKIYDDKIKISDNEENINPYEIKLSESGKVKVERLDKEIGKASYDSQNGEVSLSSESLGYTIKTSELRLAYGVLLIEEIEPELRYILLAELFAKGK